MSGELNLELAWQNQKITMCSKNILNYFTYGLTAYHIPDLRFEVYLILLHKEPFQEHSMQQKNTHICYILQTMFDSVN